MVLKDNYLLVLIDYNIKIWMWKQVNGCLKN